LNQDEARVYLLPLEAKKVPLDYTDPAYEVQEMHHRLFDQNLPEDRKDQEFQMLEYFLAGPLRVCVNKEEILHIHVDHSQAQRVSEEARYYEALSQVIS